MEPTLYIMSKCTVPSAQILLAKRYDKSMLFGLVKHPNIQFQSIGKLTCLYSQFSSITCLEPHVHIPAVIYIFLLVDAWLTCKGSGPCRPRSALPLSEYEDKS